jgi:hypothetical protein
MCIDATLRRRALYNVRNLIVHGNHVVESVNFLQAHSLFYALVLPSEEELSTMSGSSSSMATIWLKALIFLHAYSIIYALVLHFEEELSTMSGTLSSKATMELKM